jgi:hypothetical protein
MFCTQAHLPAPTIPDIAEVLKARSPDDRADSQIVNYWITSATLNSMPPRHAQHFFIISSHRWDGRLMLREYFNIFNVLKR